MKKIALFLIAASIFAASCRTKKAGLPRPNTHAIPMDDEVKNAV